MPVAPCLQEGSREGATQAYRQLQALDKSSAASAQMLAQLARASADADPAGARQMQARLPAHQQPSELDVDALEAAWAGKHSRSSGSGALDLKLQGQVIFLCSHALRLRLHDKVSFLCFLMRQG